MIGRQPPRRAYGRPRLARPIAALAMLVAILLLRLAWPGGGNDLHRYDGEVFTVVRVIDGDTLLIDAPDGGAATTRVRLWGVDTPETKRPNTPVQHYGPEASAFAAEAAEGQAVRLHLLADRTRDVYDRLLAYVILPDGRMLNRVLIEEGYGYADLRFDHPHGPEFRTAMLRARRRGAGLWASVAPEQLPGYLRGELPASAPAAARNSP